MLTRRLFICSWYHDPLVIDGDGRPVSGASTQGIDTHGVCKACRERAMAEAQLAGDLAGKTSPEARERFGERYRPVRGPE